MKNKVYIATGLHRDAPPEIIGVFRNRRDAEKAAYAPADPAGYSFTNVIEKPVL